MVHRNASYESLSDERLPVPEALFGMVCRSTLNEARELCERLPEVTRARLAIFCNARAHLRDVGRAIASACSQDILVAEGGYAGAVLFKQIREEPDQWSAGIKHPAKRITLAGHLPRSEPTGPSAP